MKQINPNIWNKQDKKKKKPNHRNTDSGMTLLEVVMAFAILSIGIGFMLMSNKAYYAFREERQQRQQMLFYAAGQMEAYLEGQVVQYSSPPYGQYTVTRIPPRAADVSPPNELLEVIEVRVEQNPPVSASEPVSIYCYRVKTE